MNRTLISLAILKINWETNRVDYIDNFIPFLGYLLYKRNYEKFDSAGLSGLKSDFKDEYGLVIPNYALLTICNRASKQNLKLLRRDSGVFYVNREKAASFDNSVNRMEVSNKFEAIILRIIDFAKEQYNMIVTESQVTDSIIAFLKHHDLDILFASHEQSALPIVSSNAKFKYVISSYAIYAKTHEQEYFNALADLAIGNALACAILYSDSTYSGRLKDLNLYLDTPLILTLLGLSGSFKEEAFGELLAMLKEDDAKLKILATTRGEVDTILSNTFDVLEKGEENIDIEKAPIAVRHCINNGITASDLELKMAGLDELLNKHGIEKSKVPDYMASKEYQIDEEELKQIIIDTYKTHSPDFVLTQRKDRTIDRDVKVLAGIYRFRRGLKPRNIRQSKDLFITSNTSLAYASRRYELKQDGDPQIVPSCLTDVFIGTFLWLQSPQKVIELNEKKFIADCYAAKQPTESLIRTYMLEVEKLKKDKKINMNDYYLLRSHQIAFRLLEEKTMGDPDEITGEAIGDIIQRIKADIKGQAEIDLQLEKQLHQDTIEELKNQKEKYAEREGQIDAWAEGMAKKLTNAIWFSIFVVLVTVYLATTNLGLNLPKIIIWFFIAVQIILTLLGLLFGFTFWGIRDKLINKIKNWILTVRR